MSSQNPLRLYWHLRTTLNVLKYTFISNEWQLAPSFLVQCGSFFCLAVCLVVCVKTIESLCSKIWPLFTSGRCSEVVSIIKVQNGTRWSLFRGGHSLRFDCTDDYFGVSSQPGWTWGRYRKTFLPCEKLLAHSVWQKKDFQFNFTTKVVRLKLGQNPSKYVRHLPSPVRQKRRQTLCEKNSHSDVDEINPWWHQNYFHCSAFVVKSQWLRTEKRQI